MRYLGYFVTSPNLKTYPLNLNLTPKNINQVAGDDQNFGFQKIPAGQQESESILLGRLKGKNKKIVSSSNFMSKSKFHIFAENLII
ncbi:hypothetical protein MSLAZ_1875 [Methanosarcina lacustris Z-7289]|uniref:Uncharacterized protein n=1 Tax=Methanosarcina lacustris Z-7289 TaxID=1434111 RepID=A0A0E3S4F5_9EURY|nr:hypothetical protein MSLAZ_1875 [Methanosarcina lacustris Z-7289]